jgi:3-hydroxyacyl-CoA dehydrogenase
MARRIGLFGAGAVAFDLGMYLLAHSRDTHIGWAGSVEASADRIARKVMRRLRLEGKDEADRVFFMTSAQAADRPLDDIVECTHESLAAKRALYALLEPRLTPRMPLLSASSSIQPHEIGELVVGLHPFVPLAFTRFAEIICPASAPREAIDAARAFAGRAGLSACRQNAASAFAVNRLLLPLQAEAARALRAGGDPRVIDEMSKTPVTPFGQLGRIRSIGVGTVAAAVKRFRSRMPEHESREYEALSAMLADPGWVESFGKPAPRQAAFAARAGGRQGLFDLLAANSALRACENGWFTYALLEKVLSDVYGARVSFVEYVNQFDPDEAIGRLCDARRRTGASYFAPSAVWRRLPQPGDAP